MKKFLGSRIKHYRERAGLSQHGLARAIQANKHSVWRWENSISWPHYEQIEAIAKAVGIEPYQLFEGMGPANAENMKSTGSMHLDGLCELLVLIAGFSEDKLTKLLKCAQEIRKGKL